MTNLDDTTRCPRDDRCQICRQPGPITVRTLSTPFGVLCRSLCDRCITTRPATRITPGEAMAAVSAHGEHLGINPGTMAALLHQEAD